MLSKFLEDSADELALLGQFGLKLLPQIGSDEFVQTRTLRKRRVRALCRAAIGRRSFQEAVVRAAKKAVDQSDFSSGKGESHTRLLVAGILVVSIGLISARPRTRTFTSLQVSRQPADAFDKAVLKLLNLRAFRRDRATQILMQTTTEEQRSRHFSTPERQGHDKFLFCMEARLNP